MAPTPRQSGTENSQMPCEDATTSSPLALLVTRGNTLDTAWTNIQTGSIVTFSLAPKDQSAITSGFVNLTSFSYFAGAGQVTIPSNSTPGGYVLRWYQISPGPYANCVDLLVLVEAPKGSTPIDGTPFYQTPYGVFDAAAGKMVYCIDGYSPDEGSDGIASSCKLTALRKSQIVGIGVGVGIGCLIIIIIVAILTLRAKNRSKYDDMKFEIGQKAEDIKYDLRAFWIKHSDCCSNCKKLPSVSLPKLH